MARKRKTYKYHDVFAVSITNDTLPETLKWINNQKSISKSVIDLLNKYVKNELVPIEVINKLLEQQALNINRGSYSNNDININDTNISNKEDLNNHDINDSDTSNFDHHDDSNVHDENYHKSSSARPNSKKKQGYDLNEMVKKRLPFTPQVTKATIYDENKPKSTVYDKEPKSIFEVDEEE